MCTIHSDDGISFSNLKSDYYIIIVIVSPPHSPYAVSVPDFRSRVKSLRAVLNVQSPSRDHFLMVVRSGYSRVYIIRVTGTRQQYHSVCSDNRRDIGVLAKQYTAAVTLMSH